MTVRWGAAISTRHRPAELVELIASLARQSVPPAAVAVVDQSTPPTAEARTRIEKIAAEAGFELFVKHGEGGLSAGRNQAFALLAGHAEWAVTPNDTSVLDPTFGAELVRAATAAPQAACLVGTYAYEGAPIREPGPLGTRLSGWELWSPIEPACVWHVGRLLACGGFDESLGTGSPGAAQSGEGTDLLLRLDREAPVVAAPAMLVHGRPHGFGLAVSARAAKDHGYAIGTGVVYRRHFPGPRAWTRLVWPAVQGLLHGLRDRDAAELRYGLARARGRCYGYFRTARALRPRGGANPSDRWR